MEAYLEHHGVKGQKWGVRRYQNEDGTRIGSGSKKKKSSLKSKVSAAKEKAMKAKERAVAEKEALKQAFLQGMMEEMNRMQMEQANQIALQNQQMINQQIMNQQFMDMSIREANRTASLSMTGGMNPFMFG